MFARILGRLRLRPGRVVEQPAPPPAVAPAERYRVAYELMDARRILVLVRRALEAEAGRPAEMRNQPLVDLALDVRSVILPPIPEPAPAAYVRPVVPVAPGRTS